MSTRSWAFFDQLRSVVNRKQTAVKYYCIFDHLSSAMMMDDLGEHSTLHSVPTSAVHPVHQPSAISHSSSSCIPRNLLTTLATSETISLFLSPPAGEARRGEAKYIRVRIQKTCWPRCRYRTMVLMMGSLGEQQPERERERQQERERERKPDNNGNGEGNESRCGVASKKVKRGL